MKSHKAHNTQPKQLARYNSAPDLHQLVWSHEYNTKIKNMKEEINKINQRLVSYETADSYNNPEKYALEETEKEIIKSYVNEITEISAKDNNPSYSCAYTVATLCEAARALSFCVSSVKELLDFAKFCGIHNLKDNTKDIKVCLKSFNSFAESITYFHHNDLTISSFDATTLLSCGKQRYSSNHSLKLSEQPISSYRGPANFNKHTIPYRENHRLILIEQIINPLESSEVIKEFNSDKQVENSSFNQKSSLQKSIITNVHQYQMDTCLRLINYEKGKYNNQNIYQLIPYNSFFHKEIEFHVSKEVGHAEVIRCKYTGSISIDNRPIDGYGTCYIEIINQKHLHGLIGSSLIHAKFENGKPVGKSIMLNLQSGLSLSGELSGNFLPIRECVLRRLCNTEISCKFNQHHELEGEIIIKYNYSSSLPDKEYIVTKYLGLANTKFEPHGNGQLTIKMKPESSTKFDKLLLITGEFKDGLIDVEKPALIQYPENNKLFNEYFGRLNRDYLWNDAEGALQLTNKSNVIGKFTNGKPDLSTDYIIKNYPKYNITYVGKIDSQFNAHGNGKMILDEGTEVILKFENGNLINSDNVEVRYKNKPYYYKGKVSTETLLPCDFAGRLIFEDKTVLTANFAGGEVIKDTIVEITYPDGNLFKYYRGKVNDQLHLNGESKVCLNNGMTIDATFINGKFDIIKDIRISIAEKNYLYQGDAIKFEENKPYLVNNATFTLVPINDEMLNPQQKITKINCQIQDGAISPLVVIESSNSLNNELTMFYDGRVNSAYQPHDDHGVLWFSNQIRLQAQFIDGKLKTDEVIFFTLPLEHDKRLSNNPNAVYLCYHVDHNTWTPKLDVISEIEPQDGVKQLTLGKIDSLSYNVKSFVNTNKQGAKKP